MIFGKLGLDILVLLCRPIFGRSGVEILAPMSWLMLGGLGLYPGAAGLVDFWKVKLRYPGAFELADF